MCDPGFRSENDKNIRSLTNISKISTHHRHCKLAVRCNRNTIVVTWNYIAQVTAAPLWLQAEIQKDASYYLYITIHPKCEDRMYGLNRFKLIIVIIIIVNYSHNFMTACQFSITVCSTLSISLHYTAFYVGFYGCTSSLNKSWQDL